MAAARKRPGLGKGLDALIPMDAGASDASAESAAGVVEVPVARVHPNPRQPRAHFDPEGLRELAVSIREHGVIQPLIVTKAEEADAYILIAGERRLLAAQEAGLEKIPVVVREATDQQRLELALIENVQRADLSPLETAAAYQQLAEEFGLAHGEIAERVGKSRVAVTNTLRLLNLPPSVKQALLEEKIAEGHARALLSLPNSQSQAAALQTVIEKKLSVRQTEALVRKLSGEKPPQRAPKTQSPEVAALQEQLRAALGTKVRMKHGKSGGTITIHYYSDEELEALLEKFL